MRFDVRSAVTSLVCVAGCCFGEIALAQPATPPDAAIPPPPPAAPAPADAPTSLPPSPLVEPTSPSEALASPEGVLIVSPPPPDGVQVVAVSAAPRPNRPIRAERRLALLGEVGWNSLAGFGVNLTFNVHPHMALDLGLGLGAVGGKFGLRARYNLLKGNVTPFLGAGLIAASGWESGSDQQLSDESDVVLKVRPSTFAQGVVGVDWISQRGFTMIGAVGYAKRISRNNVEILSGTPTAEERQGIDVVFGSSMVLSLAIGYAFR